MYSVKLADGTIMNNLELNGNNYISQASIDKSIFADNLNTITITDKDGNIEEMNNVRVIFAKVVDKDSFILVEKTKEELEKEQFNQLLADLTEMVLMGGI